ncbi:MAG: methionine gamma-lyase family protein [Eubacteriales bacterium]|nr:methionine gamma-lyase family protein [Eubacteriales bacterium]
MQNSLKLNIDNIDESLYKTYDTFNQIEEKNLIKVLKAFKKNKVSTNHFIESTGYGYDDSGRDIIDKIYANIFHTEDALVRPHFISGTHALTICLQALLRPGDDLLSITGMPYDTLAETIGIIEKKGSLKEYNISFNKVDLIHNNKLTTSEYYNDFDYEKILQSINSNTKLILIQRSKGYTNRHSFLPQELEEVINIIKKKNKNIYIMVDNCYGEFTNIYEPSDFGADVCVGSLIKNLGGGICKSGAYIVGKKEIIEQCSYRLTSPSLGKEVGCNFNQNINILQGLSFAPQMVSNAIKGATLISKLFEEKKYKVFPLSNEKRGDIVSIIELKNEDNLKLFCKIIQENSFIDSFVSPESWDMPGYNSKVIMASGSFIQGSSLELSCDAPIKEPFYVFVQGGLSYYQTKEVCKTLNEYF